MEREKQPLRPILKWGFILVILHQTLIAIGRCAKSIIGSIQTIDLADWGITVWLINYQGGFVRRGLIGELLYQLRLHAGIDPRWILAPLWIFSYVAMVTLFIHAFRKKGWAMYILPLSICLGLGSSSIKDYLLLLLYWCLLYAYIHIQNTHLRLTVVLCLSLFAINVHEAFVFFSWPMLTLLLIYDKGMNATQKGMGMALPALMFLVLSYFHGNMLTAQAIHNSWLQFIPSWEGGHVPNAAIDAIGWDAGNTFKVHFCANYVNPDPTFPFLRGFMIRPFIFLLIYYLIYNYPIFFSKATADENEHDRRLLSLILCIQFIGLIPMFTILNTDFGRMVQFWVVSSFSTLLIIPRETLNHLFPASYADSVERANSFLHGFLPYRKETMALLLASITITIVGFNVKIACMHYSALGRTILSMIDLLGQS